MVGTEKRYRLARCRLMFAVGCVIAAASPAVAQPARPASPVVRSAAAEIERFERALAADDLQSLHESFDALLDARASGPAPLRPDPLLSGLVGRLYLERGWSTFAIAYLRHADAPDVPRRQRVAALFALADAQARLGDRSGATETLRRLSAIGLDPADRSRAALTAARLTVSLDPAAALAAVEPLLSAEDPTRRFEAQFVAAQARSLLGDRAAAAAAAERAWATAAILRPAEEGPVRAAVLRAGLAASRGDRDAIIAMSKIAGASDTPLNSTFASALPVCGERGVTADDHVIFGVFGGRRAFEGIVALAASRSAVVPVFMDALNGGDILSVDHEPAAGTIITVRCRSAPAADFPAPLLRDGWAEWFADRGLFFVQSPEPDPEGIALLSRRLGQLEERLGADDARLITARLDLAERIETLGALGGGDTSESARLRTEIFAAMRRIGGTENALPPPEVEALHDRLRAARTPEDALAIRRGGMARLLALIPPDHAYIEVQDWLAHAPPDSAELSMQLVRAVLSRLPSRRDEPRRRALLLRLATVQRAAGDLSGARASWRAAGLAPGSCLALDEPPVHVEGTITDEHYPPDAIANGIAGATIVDFEVSADGRTANRRLILSAPSAIFDPITDETFAAFAFLPGRSGGQARACTGMTRSVRWQLPDDEELAPPDRNPPVARDTRI